MKKIPLLAALFLCGATFLSCERPPELPNTPKIAFESVHFGETDIVNDQDSLVVTISFEDGDGDLGLPSRDNQESFYLSATPPYDRIYDITGMSHNELLQIGDLDTLPEYNCLDYQIIPKTPGSIESDTIYVQPNLESKNFWLKFFIKKDGGFEEYDFSEETCITSSGTFDKLNSADHERPIQGTLAYSYRAKDLRQYFGDQTLKIQVRILDRAGHYSNIVESPEFTLNDILL